MQIFNAVICYQSKAIKSDSQSNSAPISIFYTWKTVLNIWLGKYTGTEIEPPNDKTNKMTAPPAKTQISLGIRPVWSESLLSGWRKIGSLVTH